MSTDTKLMDVEETSALAILAEPFKRQVQILQDYTYLAVRAVASLFTPPHYVNDLLQQMDIIGIGSLPIVLLTGAFIGAVMVLQTASQFERFGETSLTGDIVSLALVRELGPAITGLLVAGRNASGMASELGSMLVTEQVTPCGRWARIRIASWLRRAWSLRCSFCPCSPPWRILWA